MKAIVVYEWFWGNTAAVAQAIAEGIGAGAQALTTTQATADVMAGTDLLVVGAPVLAFTLPTEAVRKNLARESKAPLPGALGHPSLRSWLKNLPPGSGSSAAFETRISWSPGGATGAITEALKEAGYPPIAERERFIVTGRYGPLRDGELDRAREWGKTLGGQI